MDAVAARERYDARERESIGHKIASAERIADPLALTLAQADAVIQWAHMTHSQRIELGDEYAELIRVWSNVSFARWASYPEGA